MKKISVMIQEYRKILETRLDSATLHPWKRLDHGWESKLRVFHFGDRTTRSEVPCLDRRNNLSHLWQDLEQSVETNKPKECHRSMILLEGVDPRIAEVLSIKLNIPPEFWIAHYHENSTLKFLDPWGLEYSRSTCWSCDIPTRLRVDMGRKTRLEKPTRFGTYRGSCYRGEVKLHQTGFLLDAHSRLSFWGQPTDKGWIGLFLLDVPFVYLFPINDPITRISDPVMLRPVDVNTDPFWMKCQFAVTNLCTTNSRMIFPTDVPLWDTILDAYETQGILTTDDPFSAGRIVRNFIFTAWEDHIYRRYYVNKTVWVSGLDDSHKLRDITPEDRNAALERSHKIASEYQNLRDLWQYFHQDTLDLHWILQVFGFDEVKSLPPQSHEQSNAALALEPRRWRRLQEYMNFLDELISGNMAMFAQRAVMEEAFASRLQAYDSLKQTQAANKQAAAANRTARSSGQLAKIATVAVPCTLATSIFSMNGDFAAGEPLFFVYWCVALPLTFAMLAWTLQQDFQEWRKKSGKHLEEVGVEHSLSSDRSSMNYSSK